MAKHGVIRTGIGGWTFEPWRGTFYPADLRQKDELNFASRKLGTIEINGTYYGSQKPETFAKWAADVPEGFVFSVKGIRYVSNRKVLAESGESLEKFLNSGVTELGDSLGPILWQFAPTKKFDPDDFGAFLAMLPDEWKGVRLKHAVEVRHPSFSTPEYAALCSRYGVANVYADHFTYPEIADVTAPFVYARLQKGDDAIPTAYEESQLDVWAQRARQWASGEAPSGLPCAAVPRSDGEARDVYIYFIHEGKVNAPQAALALADRV